MFNNTLEIFVPSTLQVDAIADSELVDKVIHNVQLQLASNFGGFTTIKAKGGWVAENNQLVIEDVTIVSSFSDKNPAILWAVGTGIAKAICNIMSQEAVTVRVNGVTQFVEA